MRALLYRYRVQIKHCIYRTPTKICHRIYALQKTCVCVLFYKQEMKTFTAILTGTHNTSTCTYCLFVIAKNVSKIKLVIQKPKYIVWVSYARSDTSETHQKVKKDIALACDYFLNYQINYRVNCLTFSLCLVVCQTKFIEA